MGILFSCIPVFLSYSSVDNTLSEEDRRYISIDKNGQPISIKTMQLAVEGILSIQWHKGPPTNIYEQPFTFVYGLYSRHGQFYPPYNFVPDINYGEFVKNVF